MPRKPNREKVAEALGILREQLDALGLSGVRVTLEVLPATEAAQEAREAQEVPEAPAPKRAQEPKEEAPEPEAQAPKAEKPKARPKARSRTRSKQEKPKASPEAGPKQEDATETLEEFEARLERWLTEGNPSSDEIDARAEKVIAILDELGATDTASLEPGRYAEFWEKLSVADDGDGAPSSPLARLRRR